MGALETQVQEYEGACLRPWMGANQCVIESVRACKRAQVRGASMRAVLVLQRGLCLLELELYFSIPVFFHAVL